MAEPTILPPLDPERATTLLAPPWLPPEVARRVAHVRRAAAAAVPALLVVSPGGGRLRLARALHALCDRSGPLAMVSGLPAHLVLPAGATLYLDGVPESAHDILLLESLLDDGAVWVVVGVDPGTPLPPSLAPRLAAAILTVPPLAGRVADLPQLVATIVRTLTERSGLPPPSLGPDALARLAAHTWPGDVVELESVLARALLSGKDVEIDPAEPGAQPAAGALAARQPGVLDADLETVLPELAHEIRNPLVTVKTFANHLPELLEDAALRERFATLTDEAITRIDTLLENVLAYARLGPPDPHALDVAPLLDRVLAEVEVEMAGREVPLRRMVAPTARCTADGEHLAYALRNLFAGIVREAPAREELVLDAAMNGVVTIRLAGGGATTDRLRQLIAGNGARVDDPTLLPLVFRLARGVLERNGGSLSVVSEPEDATTVVVRLPAVVEGR